MNEFKYTKDGKKVAVIGNLNQNEYIVQEVYVTASGDEIPQGERFVVKALLDEPCKTWEERKLEELKHRYEKEKRDWETKIEALRVEKQLAYGALKARVSWLRNVAKEPQQNQLKSVVTTLADFLSNNNKWVAVQDWTGWRLAPFTDEGINLLDRFCDNRREYDSMRLLSLYGKCDGNLEWRISQYYDGSGSSNNVVFFSNKEDAINFLQEQFDKIKEYCYRDIEMAEEYGLVFDKEKMKAYEDAKERGYIDNIKKAKEQLEKYKKDYEDYKINRNTHE